MQHLIKSYALIIGVLCWLALADMAAAAEFEVDHDDDPSPIPQACTAAPADCSLRGAILKANSTPGGPHTVTLPGVLTQRLSIAGAGEDLSATGDLDITAPVIITGRGATVHAIEAGSDGSNGIDRVFDVHNGGSLALSDIEVRFGRVPSDVGGAIRVRDGGSATLDRVHITQNSASSGGGIRSEGIITVSNSTLSANTADFAGGAIHVAGGNGTNTLTNVTISGNSGSTGGGIRHGAGLGTTNLNNVTIANNTGAGIHSGIGTVNLLNSVLSGNSQNCNVGVVSQGTNLSSDATCGLNAAGDRENADPLLGPLLLNGGRTPTHLRAAGSPVVDTGNASAPGSGGNACAALDQRGVQRPVDGNGNGTTRCDKGATERNNTNVTVDRTDDVANATGCTGAGNDCSLRGAVRAANGLGGGPHTITLPAGVYTLSLAGQDENQAATGDLDITSAVTIVGAGASTTIVQAGTSPGNGIDRVFDVRPFGVLALNGITVRHGLPVVASVGATGGGIRSDRGGSTTLDGVHVTANTATQQAGGIFSFGPLVIRNSAITNNAVVAVLAGFGSGGGLVQNDGPATLVNVTISGNTSDAAGAGIEVRQGAQLFPSRVDLNNVTITANHTRGNAAAGLDISLGTITLANSIVSGNTNAAGLRNCQGAITSAGNNLSDTAGCSFTQATDITGQNPLLGPLQNNGGQTPTHVLLTGSPAIDAGNAGAPGTGGNTCASTDQRGISRPRDGDLNGTARCDIGAVEVVELDPCAPRPPVALAVTPNGQGGLAVTVTRGVGTIGLMRFRGAGSAQVPVPNALVDIGGQIGRSGDFDFTPPAGAISQQFTVRPVDPNLPVTLPVEVTDGCGVWLTLVGGGVGSISGVGTFTLVPASSQVTVGDTLVLRFTWTVPSPRIWRDLRSLELRLRDADGVAWGVRWDEASDAFTVTESRTPAPVTLAGASSQGSGPTGQSVTLTLPLLALEAAGGRTFSIEVKATDDSGLVDDFRVGGTLTVVARRDDEPNVRRLTPEQRLQRQRTNTGNFDDIHTEGTVLRVDCTASPPVVTIGNVDGEVQVSLRADAIQECPRIRPGQYLEADGEKVDEHRFLADEVNSE